MKGNEQRLTFYLAPSELGGAEVFASTMIRELSRDPALLLTVAVADTKVGMAWLASIPDTVHKLTVRPYSKGPLRRRLWSFSLWRIFRRSRGTIIVNQDLPMVAARALPSALRSGSRVLCLTHGLLAMGLNDSARQVLRGYYERCEVVLAVSRDSQKRMAALFGLDVSRIGVIGAFFDPQRISCSPEAREATRKGLLGEAAGPLFLATSRFSEEKRPDLLLKAFAKLNAPDARMVLVGDGPLLAECRQLAATLGIASRVAFEGYQKSVARYLAAADVHLLFSDSEAMPLAILEAMAAGLPVVATRVGGVPEAVEDGVTGFLVDPGSDMAAAAAMQRMLDEPLRRQMGQRAKARAESEFSLSALVARFKRYISPKSGTDGVPSAREGGR